MGGDGRRMAGWPDDDLGGMLSFRMKHVPGVHEGLYWLGALGTLPLACRWVYR